MISYRQLVREKEYYIKTRNSKYFKGMIFEDYFTTHGDLYYHTDICMRFKDIIIHFIKMSIIMIQKKLERTHKTQETKWNIVL
jgi:hypothetical protein